MRGSIRIPIALVLSNQWACSGSCQTLSPTKAIEAAENQISTTLLKSRGIPFPTEGFGSWLRANHSDIVAESHDFIGEVRQVALLDGETPRELRRRYCSISYQEDMEVA